MNKCKNQLPLKKKISCLDQRQLVGSDVKGVDIGGQAGVSLLGTVGARN
jgi:hypothetical protein